MCTRQTKYMPLALFSFFCYNYKGLLLVKKGEIKLSKIKMFSLGGLDENGKNMFVIEIDKKIIDEVMLAMNPMDSLDRIIYTDSKDLSLSDTIGDQKDYYNIDNIMLYDMINKLPSPDKEIIYLRYFEDKTQTEIASILKMNQVAVSRGEGKALKKIKSNYQNVA